MQDLNNVRGEKQAENMRKVAEKGVCLFCDEGMTILGKEKIHLFKYWFFTHNDFPYEGAKDHVLAIPLRHITIPEELTNEEIVELFHDVIPKAKQLFDLHGYTFLFRAGDTKRTAATIHHLHIHFIQGAEKRDNNHKKVVATVGFSI